MGVRIDTCGSLVTFGGARSDWWMAVRRGRFQGLCRRHRILGLRVGGHCFFLPLNRPYGVMICVPRLHVEGWQFGALVASASRLSFGVRRDDAALHSGEMTPRVASHEFDLTWIVSVGSPSGRMSLCQIEGL